MIVWGKFVRTYNTAPARCNSFTSTASSSATFPIHAAYPAYAP